MKKVPKEVAGKIYSLENRMDKAEFLLLEIKNFLKQIKRMENLHDSHRLDNYIKNITEFIKSRYDS